MIVVERPAPSCDRHETKVLFEEARRRRRRRWVIGLLASALMVGASVLVGFGGSGGGGPVTVSGGSRTPGGAEIQPPGTLAQVRVEMLDYFFPTDGADFAAGYRFSNWEGIVGAEMANECLAASGFPVTVSSAPLAYGGDNTEFPDLPYLRQHGFLVTETPSPQGVDPTQAMSTARASAFRLDVQTCRASAAVGVNSLMQTGAPLQEQWMNVVTAIDAQPQFQRALVGWRSCTRRAGVDVTTISDFFTYADSQATHGGSAQDSLHLARIYATCLAPAEAVRDQLRQQARVSFSADHADAVAQLTSMLASLKVRSEG